MMKMKNELFYQRSYYAEAQWIDVLGDTTYCIWKKLITHVDRSKDAMSKYGNKNTVPFSLTRLAENMNMSVNKLKAHARKLWNYGLIDFIEWAACYKLGKKPLNIVVYNYPQNDTAYATKNLKQVRDYDVQYASGKYEVYVKEKSAEIYAIQVSEEYTPFIMPPVPESVENDPEPVFYDLAEVYPLFDDNIGQFVEESNHQPLNYMNGQSADHSNHQAVDEHKYNSNALFNKTNTLNNSNAFNNSSSSLDNSKQFNNAHEEDESITSPIKIDFELIKSVLQVALELRNVTPRIINRIIKLARELQLPYVTIELISEQLDQMATEKECGRRIYDFAKYFVNGLLLRIEDSNFYENNSYLSVIKRRSVKLNANQQPQRKIFNWLEHREGVQYA